MGGYLYRFRFVADALKFTCTRGLVAVKLVNPVGFKLFAHTLEQASQNITHTRAPLVLNCMV
jgi:hypothetical protein